MRRGCRDLGWRVRVLTRYVGQGPDLDEIRAAWRPDDRTTVVIVDPSSPNILQFNPGKGVQAKLARPFFVELQSRFGNLFYVREEVGPRLLPLNRIP